MESSERAAKQPVDANQDVQVVVTMAPHVPPSTVSTVNPASTAPPKDGSVVSAVTDPASLEGQCLAESSSDLAFEKEEEVNDDPGVPEQVILEENGSEDASSDGHNPPDELHGDSQQQEQAAAAASPADKDATASVSAAGNQSPVAADDASPTLSAKRPPSVSVGETSEVTAEAVDDQTTDDHSDDYIRSPEVQNAIVERSPGERYVRFMEKLGSGASKDVYRAYDTQEGIEVAWNVVNLAGVPKTERNRIVNEVRLLERLHHHNIISFHGSWVNRERQEVNFVTEILSSGTLKSFIAKVQVIRWKIAKRWAVQILNGLEYLHSQDPPVIHRDLKCENLFINGTSGDLRIGDLGLSTVHRNGRVLSVLGTPEFMAPDMYEESSYDQRVDIYAFGMCMLEIFTKEIPYSECRNPAQIYKKVSNGEPPEVLRRLQSRHAREFVMLCLGYRDENGQYVRPTATELLQHPFLVTRANEDDEVVVDPPLRESAISEVGEPSTTTTFSDGSPAKQQSTEATAKSGEHPPDQSASPPPTRSRSQRSLDEDLSDQFDEMPQTESNMRKVKVMMGRGQELEEEETSQLDEAGPSGEGSVQIQAVEANTSALSLPTGENVKSFPHHLVAAAVIENEGPETRPYPDDVLKLVVTLPVEGQTQNVQFDFHLVEDDPVQVAKEMVQELGIPQSAILEISETISGLAWVARKKVDNFYNRTQQPHGHVRTHSQQGLQQVDPSQSQPLETSMEGMYNEGPLVSLSNAVDQILVQSSQQPGLPVEQGVQLPSQNQSVPQPQPMQAHVPTPQQTGLPVEQCGQSVSQQQQIYVPVSNAVQQAPQQPGLPVERGVLVPSQSVSQQPQQQQQQQPMYVNVPVSNAVLQNRAQPGLPVEHGAQLPSQSVSQQQQQQPMYVQHQSVAYGNLLPSQTHPARQAAEAMPPPMPVPQPGPAVPGSTQILAPQASHPDHSLHGQAQGVPVQHGSSPPGMAPQQGSAQVISSQQGASLGSSSQQHGSVQAIPPPPAMTPPTPQSHQGIPASQMKATGVADGTGATTGLSTSAPSSHSRHATSPPELNTVAQPNVVHRSSTTGASTTVASPSSSTQRRRPLSFGGSTEVSSPSDGVDSEQPGPHLSEELRKLDEDFQRNLERAKKVFDNRMDNLQRSQVEREAQHMKTLEKHQKEQLEFERRLAQEEEQQNRRIEQLQREWDKKRETLALQRTSILEGNSTHSGANGVNVPSQELPVSSLTPPPTHRKSQRSNSNVSSLSAGAIEEHLYENQEQTDMNGVQDR